MSPYSPLLHMLRRIHIHECWLILRRKLSTFAELRKPWPRALLGQSVIRQDHTYVLVFDD